MEHHATCLVNVAVYGPIVDQLVVSDFQSQRGPALIPPWSRTGRLQSFERDTCPGSAVEPDLFLPGRALSSSNTCPGPVAFENVYPTPDAPLLSAKTPAPVQ